MSAAGCDKCPQAVVRLDIWDVQAPSDAVPCGNGRVKKRRALLFGLGVLGGRIRGENVLTLVGLSGIRCSVTLLRQV